MPQYSQEGRPMAVTTPLGADALLLEGFSATESLSTLFRLELDLLAEADTAVAFEQILGQGVTVSFPLPEGGKRYFNGIVSRFREGPQVPGVQGEVTFVRYRAEVVPRLWLLTLQARSRIFQQMSVPDILKEVLTGLDVSWEIQGTFEPRDYCVQYRETDFAFASRLLEEEGIYYYFKHADGSHQMVVADTPQSHADVPGPTTLIYEEVEGGYREEDRILGWEKSQEVRPGKVALWDHCFELPGQNLEATKATLDSVSAGTVTHKLKVGVNDGLEVYDFPGGYAGRFDGIAPGGGDRASDVQKIFQDNTRTAGLRMDQEAAPALSVEGISNVRHLCAGHAFTLDRHFNANGDYVLTGVEHEARLHGAYTPSGGAAGGRDFVYQNRFRCIPKALPYRPRQVTPRAKVEGLQSATVVGPSGEEIFTDKYGRVKVQFAWHREGKKDADSSCWVRVGTVWAGKQWGAIHIPRVGQEVLVAFEEGSPDRPVIVGSVYNAEQMPPYTLPDNRTQSGIKSRSSLKGTGEHFNELRFEDKKDEEEVYFHAEKDFNRVVENDDTLKVGFEKKDKGDQTIEVFNNQTLSVGAGKGDAADGSQTITVYKNRTETVEEGDETVTIKKGKRLVQVDTGDDTHHVKQGKRIVNVDTGNDEHTVKTGNRTVTVSTGNDEHKVEKGNRTVEVSMGNDELTIKMGNQTTKLNLGKSTTDAMQGIELKVGANSIKIDQSGITLKGMMIKVEGQVQTEVKGAIVQIQGSGMTMVKGGVVMIN